MKIGSVDNPNYVHYFLIKHMTSRDIFPGHQKILKVIFKFVTHSNIKYVQTALSAKVALQFEGDNLRALNGASIEVYIYLLYSQISNFFKWVISKLSMIWNAVVNSFATFYPLTQN